MNTVPLPRAPSNPITKGPDTIWSERLLPGCSTCSLLPVSAASTRKKPGPSPGRIRGEQWRVEVLEPHFPICRSSGFSELLGGILRQQKMELRTCCCAV